MTFPENLNQRNAFYLECIESGNFELEWYPIQVTDSVRIWVSSDALKIDGIRINVTAAIQQMIADRIGGILPTTEIADLIWVHGDRISPSTQPITLSVAGMVRHSKEVSDKLSKIQNRTGLATNTGKHWVLDNMLLTLRKNYVINYGWHLFPGATTGGLTASLRKVNGHPLRLIQTRGTAHDWSHTDYSQTCTLVNKVAEVDGRSVDITEILKQPNNPLTWDRKPLQIFRIPSVPVYTGPTTLPSVLIQG